MLAGLHEGGDREGVLGMMFWQKQKDYQKVVLVLAFVVMAAGMSPFFSAGKAWGQEVIPPEFSHPGGFYEEGFWLTIMNPSLTGEVYYTLDGTEPTKESILYEEPVLIEADPDQSKPLAYIPTTGKLVPERFQWQPPKEEPFCASVVRARVIEADATMSQVVTTTYLVDEKGAGRYTLPVISLSINPEDLFCEEKGLYVPGDIYQKEFDPSLSWGHHPGNYNQRGHEWERPIHMEFYEKTGELGFSQLAGLRIHGSFTRAHPLKSLRIYARSDYGENRIEYPLFGDDSLPYYKRLILRGAGQDFYYAYMRDALAHSLMKTLDVAIQDVRPAVVFVNGVYWGIHYVRERYDDWYIEAHYGIERDQVVMIENDGALMAGKPGDEAMWFEMRDFLFEQGLEEQDAYEAFIEQIDLTHYLDYLCLALYSSNRDWPGNNVRFWRVRDPEEVASDVTEADGRFRWLINDLDVGFGNEAYNMFTLVTREETGWPTPPWATIMIKRLLENESFVNALINRMDFHLNTTFQSERVLKKIDDFEAILYEEMAEHIRRWQHPASFSAWQSQVDGVRNFAEKRPEYMRAHLEEFFDLAGTARLRVDKDDSFAGTLIINDIVITQEDLPWEGIFAAGVPIEIRAEPDGGHALTGWEHDRSEDHYELTLVIEEDKHIRPIFAPDGSASSLYGISWPVWGTVAVFLFTGLGYLFRQKRERAFEDLRFGGREDADEREKKK